MKRIMLALVAGLSLAVACWPGKSFALTFTPYQAGQSFTIAGAVDGTDMVTGFTWLPVSLAQPLQLLDFTLQDDKYNGIPELSLELGIYDCRSGSCMPPLLYNSATGYNGVAMAPVTLDPGNYLLEAYVVLYTAPGVERFDGYTVSGRFAAVPVATTPIPPAMLMFTTAIGSLGGFGWLRRRRSATRA